jgi:dolichyl-phosphate-mannose--protein O-mannosyl transferase
MKKAKQILAIIGVILLVGLYVTTLVLAITDNSATMNVFFASIVATVMIPVLIWAYTFIYRLVTGKGDKGDPSDRQD